MLNKLLIANRGEIAVRIAATANRMGIATVAVFSDADRGAMHVHHADEAVHIGAGPATESYLRIDRIIEAAKATAADAIHPGYGFLAENPALAEACAAAGIAFVGPSADAMRRMGGKAEAKAIAEAAGVPVVPGWRDPDGKITKHDVRKLQREATRIGYPVLIKAVAGGGGRGMRLVERPEDFAESLESAEREALSSFGDARVLIEKVVVRPRHIEVQVFGDRHGNVLHLFERDCTLQRRNQKVIEEAPAPGMSVELRDKITSAAVACAKAVSYEGAGTVEFLVEGGLLGPKAPWYFIEMNTRLQVEHPVTEAITGLDLVEWQLRVAAGETLPLVQDQITIQGHAVEARLYAEDPANGFRPQVGRLVALELPEAGTGVRVDTGFSTGDTVSPFYDAMLAKIITSAGTRDEALDQLSGALAQAAVAGPRTNTAFLKALVDDDDVRAVRLDTGLIGRKLEELVGKQAFDADAAATGAMELWFADRELARTLAGFNRQTFVPTPWDTPPFQLGGERRIVREVIVDGQAMNVEINDSESDLPTLRFVGIDAPCNPYDENASSYQMDDADRHAPIYVIRNGRQTVVEWPTYDIDAALESGDGTRITAPINGRVAKVFVTAGDTVAKGDRIAVIEAMKMEHVLHSARDGTIATIAVSEGAQVTEGALVAALTEEEAA